MRSNARFSSQAARQSGSQAVRPQKVGAKLLHFAEAKALANNSRQFPRAPWGGREQMSSCYCPDRSSLDGGALVNLVGRMDEFLRALTRTHLYPVSRSNAASLSLAQPLTMSAAGLSAWFCRPHPGNSLGSHYLTHNAAPAVLRVS
jgi:hypothetical protein